MSFEIVPAGRVYCLDAHRPALIPIRTIVAASTQGRIDQRRHNQQIIPGPAKLPSAVER
jgi:hypothetical protein